MHYDITDYGNGMFYGNPGEVTYYVRNWMFLM